MSPRYGEDANGSAKVSRAGKNFIAAEAVTHSTAYDPINLTAAPKELPNMLFVPLKTREPVVQAREFAVFLLMLLSFTVIHSQQNFGQDFVTNSGMADGELKSPLSMCSIPPLYVLLDMCCDNMYSDP